MQRQDAVGVAQHGVGCTAQKLLRAAEVAASHRQVQGREPVLQVVAGGLALRGRALLQQQLHQGQQPGLRSPAEQLALRGLGHLLPGRVVQLQVLLLLCLGPLHLVLDVVDAELSHGLLVDRRLIARHAFAETHAASREHLAVGPEARAVDELLRRQEDGHGARGRHVLARGRRQGQQPPGDLQHGEGVAAERQEVVVGPDALPPQHLAPDCRHGALERRQRLRGAGRDLHDVGQLLAVDLAVGRQRQLLHEHETARQHVPGQHQAATLQQVVAHHWENAVGLVHHDRGGRGDLAVGVEEALAEHHAAVAQEAAGGLDHAGLDVPELHAHAADLDLVVEAPEDLELAVHHAAAVPRAVPPALQAREGDEPLRGQLRPVVVAHAHLHAALDDLALLPGGHGAGAALLQQP
mmetsp:Transcript_85721/g.266522  ORF Transcript_85721/g.266522 Transcript_85721/m.266522 type:complete len:409 (+) Transcript_85721:502-1728(+)